MSITRIIQRNSYAVAAALVAFAALLPSIVMPLQASAAGQVTARSIQMTSSKHDGTGVTYKATFTTATTATLQGIVIDFCSESPLLGSSSCTLPSGMTVGTTSPTLTGTGVVGWTPTAATINTGRTLKVTDGSNATSTPSGTTITLTVGGFTNQTAAGTFYARILTYTVAATAGSYTAGTPGAYTDGGGVALSTTESIGVTARVLESLTFCVSGGVLTTSCGAATAPSITLGQGSPAALDTSNVSTANVYTLLSTNAAGATVVNMKTADADLASGASTIPAKGALGTITAGTAAFGMHLSDGTNGSGGSGTVLADAAYKHATTDYAMVTADVESTYGDTIASVTGPVLYGLNTLTFAATAGATTPAGVYTSELSLIATSSY